MVNNIISSAEETLYKIYDALNEKYYQGNLPNVVITIQDAKGKYYGWFSCDRWKNSSEDQLLHEINISPEYFSRSIEELCATMNHEMVHLYCHLNDIGDTSANGKYHNKKFKKEAEERGLIITKANGIGWSVTTPTDGFVNFVKSLDISNAFSFFRVLPPKRSNVASSASQKKYVCPCCGAKLRGKSGLHIICDDCKETFIEE